MEPFMGIFELSFQKLLSALHLERTAKLTIFQAILVAGILDLDQN